MALLGSIISLASDTTVPASFSARVQWDTETVIGTSGLNVLPSPPDRLILPAGYDGKYVEVFSWFKLTTALTSPRAYLYWAPGGFGFDSLNDHQGTQTLDAISLRSGPLLASTNDEYSIYGSGGTLDATEANFAIVTLERLGFVSAALTGDLTAPGTITVLDWATPDVDGASTFNSPSGFVAPTGAVAAVVSLTSYNANGPDVAAGFTLYKDASAVRTITAPTGSFFYGPTPVDFGLIPISAGEEITIAYDGACDLQAANTRIGIEWI